MRIFKFLILSLVFTISACGGRTPTPERTAQVAKKHFQKYGKKYRETPFGQSKIEQVDVKAVEELQKNVATSFMVVKMQEGSQIPLIATLLRKFPTGWRITGWEEAQKPEAAPTVAPAPKTPENPE